MTFKILCLQGLTLAFTFGPSRFYGLSNLLIQHPCLYYMWHSILDARVYKWSNISWFLLICVSVAFKEVIAADYKSSNYHLQCMLR